MKTKFSLMLIPIIAVALFMGFVQISSDNDVFDRSMAYCCNNGFCHDEECDDPSSIASVEPRCPDYMGDCYDCMDIIWYLYDGPVCGYIDPAPEDTWCCETSAPCDSSDRYWAPIPK